MSPGNLPSHGTDGTNIQIKPKPTMVKPTRISIQAGCCMTFYFASSFRFGGIGLAT
jgi:hypothetical protein